MLVSVVLLQIVLWISWTNAFFVWKPCAVDGSCSDVKKTSVKPSGAAKNSSQGIITFDLVQKSRDVCATLAALTRHMPLAASMLTLICQAVTPELSRYCAKLG